jgi:hypothetical protein
MKWREFEMRVKNSAAGRPMDSLDVVLKAFNEEDSSKEYYSADVQKILRLADNLPKNVSVPPPRKETPIPKMNAKDRAYCMAIIDRLEDEVERIRKDIFGSIRPPFKTLKAATNWIEQTAAQRSIISLEESDILRRIRELSAKTSKEVSIRGIYLDYPKRVNGEWWNFCVPAVRGGKLWQLAHEVEEIARVNLKAGRVTAWVLCGLHPGIQRIRITQHEFHGIVDHQWISIEFNSSDVAFHELWHAYQEVRNSTAGRNRLTPMHGRILEIVRQRGGEPQERGKKTQFWESIRNQIEKEAGSAPKTWQAISKAYKSMKNRI